MRIHFTQDTKVRQCTDLDWWFTFSKTRNLNDYIKCQTINVLSLSVGYVYTYIIEIHRFVYVSQCCTEHTTTSAWSASQHCHRLNIQHCMWHCRSSLLCCDNWWIDLDEHIHSRISKSIATGFRTFQPHRLKRPVIRWTHRCTCVSVMSIYNPFHMDW